VRVAFALRAWAACAPGLETSEQWLEWAQCPAMPNGDVAVDLPTIAPMLRRRLGRLGRLALNVTEAIAPDGWAADLPVVWASR
jgi:hypothetical protein